MSATPQNKMIRSRERWVSPYEWTSKSDVVAPENANAKYNVMVRMLSGDLLTIEINPYVEIKWFPTEFVQQAGYNPTLIRRFKFLVEDEKADGEMTDLLLNPTNTWIEHFSSTDAIPLIHFLVESPREEIDPKKVELLRSILEEKRLTYTMNDDEIMGHYDTWFLTYNPPPKSNRYTYLIKFVHSNMNLFVPIAKEYMTEMLTKYEDLKTRDGNLEKQIKEKEQRCTEIAMILNFRLNNLYEIYEKLHKRNTMEHYKEKRQEAMARFTQEIELDPLANFMKVRQDEIYFNTYLTTFEMADMGYLGSLITLIHRYHPIFPTPTIVTLEDVHREASAMAEKGWRRHLAHLAEFGETSTDMLERDNRILHSENNILKAEKRENESKMHILADKLKRMKLI